MEMQLVRTEQRVELQFSQRGGPAPIYVDFVDGPLGYTRRVNRFGLLFDAVGFKRGRPSVIDCTAGLGSDAFRLAYHGARVVAIERSSIVFALLHDGVERALREPEIREKLGDRLCIVQGDANQYLQSLAEGDRPDVIYLDPMYPPKSKTALPKVEMRVLRQLVGDDLDASDLLAVALRVARQRVVVKRHRNAEPLGPRPTHDHCDKTTRYDVYLIAT
ncbi:MAG: class I SAM-dependent methyltransferase [Phycisphaerae bacterium]